jgi:hypothetical protein
MPVFMRVFEQKGFGDLRRAIGGLNYRKRR